MQVLSGQIIRESAKGWDTVSTDSVLLTARKLFLTQELNSETCDTLLKNLMALDQESDEPITLYINSPGGDVYSAYALIDFIRVMRSPLTTCVIGTAASMGALLFLTGERRLVFEHSRIMVHDPSFGNYNVAGMKPHQLQEMVNDLKGVQKITAQLICDVTGKSLKEVLKVTKDDRYFNANEALEFGLATEIISK